MEILVQNVFIESTMKMHSRSGWLPSKHRSCHHHVGNCTYGGAYSSVCFDGSLFYHQNFYEETVMSGYGVAICKMKETAVVGVSMQDFQFLQ